MNIIKKYLPLLFIFQSFLFAQSGWFQQSSGTNKKLNSGYFLNDNTGFAAGNGGVILKTTNSGINWANVYSVGIYDVLTVSFLNSITGWAFIQGSTTDSTFLLKTTNSGSSWNKSFIDTTYVRLNTSEFRFLNENTGYLANSIDLKKTTNGGLSWVVVNSGALFPSNLTFLSETTGWAAGFQTSLYKTTDGGQNWFQQFKNQSNTFSRGIIFPNSTTGFYATDYYIYRSTDGGDNWSESFYAFNIYPASMSFLNANTGWALSSIADTTLRNVVLKTVNAGISWNVYELNLQNRKFRDIFFSSQNTGWIVGDSGYIYRTTNGGVPIGIQPISTEIPGDYSLWQNYPNPFNPSTKISFSIPLSRGVSEGRGVFTKLIVYDILGREVEILLNEELRPGTYEIDFDGSNYPSGVYYYKLSTGSYVKTRKMVLVK
ncbi:MAG: T9SS type A sorting domain-containing protein [Ignavibacteria bacterium]